MHARITIYHLSNHLAQWKLTEVSEAGSHKTAIQLGTDAVWVWAAADGSADHEQDAHQTLSSALIATILAAAKTPALTVSSDLNLNSAFLQPQPLPAPSMLHLSLYS